MENFKQSLIAKINELDKANGVDRYQPFLEEASTLKLLSIIELYTPAEGGPISEDDVTILPYNLTFKKYMELDGYDAFGDWIAEQILMGDCHYYSKCKEDFFEWEAVMQAAKLGKRFVICENMS